MSCQHKELSQGRWFKFSLPEQLANIGSEVIRAINWKEKGREDYFKEASLRVFELLDLTIKDEKNKSRLKEILRLRELLADFLWFDNQYHSAPESFKKYFYAFNYYVNNKSK
jgi:hypothetical protein